MLSVNNALNLIQQHVAPLAPVTMPLANAAGLMLANDIISPGNFPPFRQSSMDGYAFAHGQWNGQGMPISGEVEAGADNLLPLLPGHAVRIFTGAPVPHEADTVVMQEKTLVQNEQLVITDNLLQMGANVRAAGSDIAAGELALAAGTYLAPGTLGFIAGLGIHQVTVYPPPTVSIILTGKELQQQGKPLQFGQVYESNSFAITATLQQCGIQQIATQVVTDELALVVTAIKSAAATSQLVLLTGGVSVGDYDFVQRALQQLNAQIIFYQLKQRPGKPLLFAKLGNTIIFGLPGNPSSVLTCLYMYVLPALQYLTKRTTPFIPTVTLPMATNYTKNTQLTHFLKGWYSNGQVTPLAAQESYRMRSFAVANCLIVLPEDTQQVFKGDPVQVHLLF